MDYLLKKYNPSKNEKELLFELALVLHSNSKFTKSVDVLAEVSGMDGLPGKADILFLKALNFKSLRKPTEALKSLLDVLPVADDNNLLAECEELIHQFLTGTDSAEMYTIVEEQAKTVELNKQHRATIVFEKLLAYVEKQRAIILQKNEALQKELHATIASAAALADKNNFAEALTRTEQALLLQPDNPELLFLKIRILVEGQLDIDKAVALLTDEDYGYLHVHGDVSTAMETVLQQINQHPRRGNTWFFAAFVGNITNYDGKTLAEWIKNAEQLGLTNNNTYPDTGLYLLKAEVAKKNGDSSSAGVNFLEAGKQLYWSAAYPEAAKYFKKATELNAALNDAFKYWADSIFILSYRNTPPYSDEVQLNEAFSIWHSSPQQAVQNANDAWHYIIIARILESRFSFSRENFYNDYWQALLYAERALVHNNNNVSFLTYLGKYFRLLGLEKNAGLLLEKAASLSNGGDITLQEEIAIVQLNTGRFNEAAAWLADITKKIEDENKVLLPHYKSWQAYIDFYRDKNYTKALSLFNEVLAANPTEIFVLLMKMLCCWYSADAAGAKSTAAEILALDNNRLYPREVFAFAWAFFIQGDAVSAISRMESFQTEAGPGGDQSYSLAQFYLYNGDTAKASGSFEFFINYCNNIKILDEFTESLRNILSHLKANTPAAGISPEAFVAISNEWTNQVAEKIRRLTSNPVTATAELEQKLEELSSYSGALWRVALKASLARVSRSEKNFAAAFQYYLELLKYPVQFSEGGKALSALTDTSTDLIPLVTGIAFELSSDLVPPDAESQDWYVIKDLIPAMKKRIFDRCGVQPPFVRIRGNEGDLAPGSCIFMLDEVPLLMCTVEKGKYFVATDAGAGKDSTPGFVAATNPLTGKQSGWVDEDTCNILARQQIPTWNVFEFIIFTLEALLCNNLPLFIDDQFCQDYLAGDSKKSAAATAEESKFEQVTDAIKPHQRLLFKQVLKNLAREKISLKNSDAIIGAFAVAAGGSEEASLITEQVRLAIKKDLPVNTLRLQHIELPELAQQLIASSLVNEDGKIFLAMPPEDCQEALSYIREVVGGNPLPDTTALIVANPALRYHVKKLVELEFPNLVVASQDEYKPHL